MESPTVLGKGRRVENDEVILVAGFLQELEGVLAKSLMAGVTREIEFHIGTCQFDGLA